jgi:hypothetical protein
VDGQCGRDRVGRLQTAREDLMLIEPGERLIARAGDQLGNAGNVDFVNRRLEEASLPHAHYSAVFGIGDSRD